jgi:hypothetical protein
MRTRGDANRGCKRACLVLKGARKVGRKEGEASKRKEGEASKKFGVEGRKKGRKKGRRSEQEKGR